jgi:hypothetical protein
MIHWLPWLISLSLLRDGISDSFPSYMVHARKERKTNDARPTSYSSH